MQCYVYVLRSRKDGGFYTGITHALERRLSGHNGGHVKPTRGRRPLELVYQEKLDSRKQARKRERYLKSGAGREFRDSRLHEHPQH